jgi:hypothetical protein
LLQSAAPGHGVQESHPRVEHPDDEHINAELSRQASTLLAKASSAQERKKKEAAQARKDALEEEDSKLSAELAHVHQEISKERASLEPDVNAEEKRLALLCQRCENGTGRKVCVACHRIEAAAYHASLPPSKAASVAAWGLRTNRHVQSSVHNQTRTDGEALRCDDEPVQMHAE